MIRSDADGMFLGQNFKRYCSAKGSNYTWQLEDLVGKWVMWEDILEFSKKCSLGTAHKEKEDLETHLPFQYTVEANYGSSDETEAMKSLEDKKVIRSLLQVCETCTECREGLAGGGCESHGATCTPGKEQNHCGVATRPIGVRFSDEPR